MGLSAMALIREMNVLLAKWNEFDSSLRSAIMYLSCTIAFMIFYFSGDSLFAIIGRAAFGFLTLILLPGAFLVGIMLPPRLKNIASTLLIGLLLAVVEVQVLFIATLLFSVQVLLVLWLSLFSLAIALVSMLCHRVAGNPSPLRDSFRFEGDRHVYGIIAAAIVIRVIMAFVAMECIAPDASLYADYARGIVDGTFSSSVVNDLRIYNLWNGVQYCFHQAFTYLFALSWIMLPPGTSGPTLILIICGILLILSSYRIAKHYFGTKAAKGVAALLAFHPLFVFHSAVGYGPEITSLTFIMGGLSFLVESRERHLVTYTIAGMFIGLVDLIWYSNFLLLCVALPILVMFLRIHNRLELVTLIFIMGFALFARLFYIDAILFLLCWISSLILVGVVYMKKPSNQLKGLGGLALGIFAMIAFWRWPVQVLASSSLSWAFTDYGLLSLPSHMDSLMLTAPNPNINVLFAPITLEITGRFILFLLFHITPVLFLAILSGLAGGKMKSHAVAFLLAGLAAAFGTLKLFSAFARYKEPLATFYLFSDSRFFLFMTLMGVLSAGAFFAKFEPDSVTAAGTTLAGISFRGKRIRLVFILGIILIGFVPAYLVIPSGLSLVRIEERYGWYNLPTEIDMIGDENSRFLVARAPEFSWLTRRSSAYLSLSTSDTTTAKALARITLMVDALGVDYLVIDGYALARFRTMHSLLSTSISVDGAVILDMSILSGLEALNTTGQVPAIALVAETSPNIRGDYTRVFEFTQTDFSRTWKFDGLDGWYAENNGDLVNLSGQVEIVIGNGKNHTQMRRAATLDLGVGVSGGFLLCHVTENGANLERIEVVDAYGESIGFAEPWTNGLYFLIVGDADVGDIRITCSGEEGQSIAICYLALWQHSQ